MNYIAKIYTNNKEEIKSYLIGIIGLMIIGIGTGLIILFLIKNPIIILITIGELFVIFMTFVATSIGWYLYYLSRLHQITKWCDEGKLVRDKDKNYYFDLIKEEYRTEAKYIQKLTQENTLYE